MDVERGALRLGSKDVRLGCMKTIPYNKQSIDQSDTDAVAGVLTSQFLTTGPLVNDFETALQDYLGVNHCVAVNSATSALHIALRALDIGPGDLVWVPAITFTATANAVRYCGADVEFCDVDRVTSLIDLDKLANQLQSANSAGSTPKALIVVHMAGLSVDMKKAKALCDSFGVKLMEDASHALGADYNGRKVGCCEYSDCAIFSFHPVKMITTGEGGCVTTNSSVIHRTARLLRSHGIIRDGGLDLKIEERGAWVYDQVDLGYNYRLTDIQAALGLSQLSKLNQFVAHRTRVAQQYDSALESLSSFLSVPVWETEEAKSSLHIYPIRLKNNTLRKALYDHLHLNGIAAQVHYRPVYQLSYYQRYLGKSVYLSGAEDFYSRTLSLPIYVDFSEKDQSRVIQSIKEFYNV